MPNPRQQRAGRNRRVITINAPPNIVPLAVHLDYTAGHLAALSGLIFAQPPNGAPVRSQLILSGIPQIKRALTGDYPTAAYYQPIDNTINLTYPGAALDRAEQFVIGPNDPAVRTVQGGFLAAGLVQIDQTDPPVRTYTAVVQIDGSVLVTPVAYGGTPLLANPYSFNVIELGTPPVQTIVVGEAYTITYGVPAVVGQHIAYTGPQPQSGGEYFSIYGPAPVELT